MSELSEELQELALEAVELALECYSEGDHSPFILFEDESGESQVIDVKSADGNITPELVENAKRVVAESLSDGALRYAIAYDGYWTNEEGKSDAVIVEAGERGEPNAWRIVQTYRVQKRSRKATRTSPPELYGPAEQLLG